MTFEEIQTAYERLFGNSITNEIDAFSEARDNLSKAFKINTKDERFWFLLQGYADARDGKKRDLWEVVRMGYDDGLTGKKSRSERNKWIEQRQKLYEKGYDFFVLGDKKGKVEDFLREYVKRVN